MGDRSYAAITFAACNPRLVDDVLAVLERLGMKQSGALDVEGLALGEEYAVHEVSAGEMETAAHDLAGLNARLAEHDPAAVVFFGFQAATYGIDGSVFVKAPEHQLYVADIGVDPYGPIVSYHDVKKALEGRSIRDARRRVDLLYGVPQMNAYSATLRRLMRDREEAEELMRQAAAAVERARRTRVVTKEAS